MSGKRFVSLFAGIGGIDLGLERAGHTCVGQVEIDDYATNVLEKHWPNTPRIRDVRDFHGHEFGEFDLLTGGYPCQPFSYAGQRQGEHDERHLWPEVHRIIRKVRPQYVLLENVAGHLSLGFGRVLGDLAESGYDVRWDCIPAAAVGAPHRRDRVFILANAVGLSGRAELQWESKPIGPIAGNPSGDRATANTDSVGRLHRQFAQHPTEGRQHAQRDTSASSTTLAHPQSSTSGQPQPHRLPQTTRAAKLGKRSSKPRPLNDWWETEPNVGRVANGIPNRVDRLRGLGNAVVPQVIEWIARNWL